MPAMGMGMGVRGPGDSDKLILPAFLLAFFIGPFGIHRFYVAKTGSLTFAAGETSKTITIEVKGDSKKENNETFYLDLFGNSENSLFTMNRGTGTILNDD